MKKIAIRFLKSAPPYNALEVAGFDESKAADYVRRGVAELFVKNEIEIPTEPTEPTEPETNQQNAEITALLLGSKQEILDAILATDDNADCLISDTMLGDLLFCERQGRNRKTVVKVIEDVSFDRIKNR